MIFGGVSLSASSVPDALTFVNFLFLVELTVRS